MDYMDVCRCVRCNMQFFQGRKHSAAIVKQQSPSIFMSDSDHVRSAIKVNDDGLFHCALLLWVKSFQPLYLTLAYMS